MVQNSTKTTQSSNSSQTIDVVKGQMGEVAVGYFMPFNKYGTLSVCGGYGAGNVTNNWTVQGISSANISKVFIQPSLGIRQKYVELIISAKLANLNYSNLSQNYTNQDLINQFNTLKGAIPIFESATVVRFGSKNVKVQLSATSMRLLKSAPLFRYEGSSIGLGVCIQLNPKKDF